MLSIFARPLGGWVFIFVAPLNGVECRESSMTEQKGAEQAASSLAEQALNQARARFAPIANDAELESEPLKKKPGRKAAVNATSSTLQDLEKTLWATADKLRANMDAAEYKHLVLGLIFLKYISDSFTGRRVELERRFADANDDYYLGSEDAELLANELEERDYFKEVNVFWVPELARWESLRANAKQVDIGKRIDEALAAIEAENPPLKTSSTNAMLGPSCRMASLANWLT